MNELNIAEQPKAVFGVHPKKFLTWMFITSIVMLFAALTSAYIVRQSEGNWLDFQLPSIFYINTLILLVSSLTMHFAVVSAKKDNIEKVKVWLFVTTGLGIIFLIAQIFAWEQLVEINVYFVGNPAGSFVYVLTGLHGFHIVSGLVFLIIVLIRTFQYKVHSKSLTSIQNLATYWHFLDGLWLYLLIFLLLNR